MEINFSPTLKQHMLFQYFDDLQTTEVLYGGAASGGKSYGICALMIIKALQYPNIRIGLARNEFTTLKRTTLVSLFEVLNNWGFQPNDDYIYNQQSNEIKFKNESKIILIELSYNPSDPLFQRINGQLLTFACVDEAGEVPEKGKQILQSRLGRWKNKSNNIKPILYMTCNPSKNFLYQQFYKLDLDGILPDYKKYIKAVITDNPFMDISYRENLYRTLSISDKERLINGNWDYNDDPTCLLEFPDINNIFIDEETVIDNPTYYISADIAFTSDNAVILIWKENIIIEIITNPVSIETSIKEKQKQYGVKSHNVSYDSDGVGKYLMNYLPNAKGIVNNGKALNEENYINLKTQLYFKLSELIRRGNIGIVGNLQYKSKIIEELSVIKHKPSSTDGKIQLISKSEVKQLIGRSPDFTDAMAYKMIFNLKSNKFQTEFYSFNF